MQHASLTFKTYCMPKLIVALMIFGIPTLSYAYVDSVEPGNNETSLIVTFSEKIKGRIQGNIPANAVCSNSGEGTYLFEWREKTPQEDEDWQSASKTYEYSWNSCDDSHQTETFTIEGLKPGTTYEVRYNSGAIYQGTTGGDPEAEDETAVEAVTWGFLKSKVMR